MNRDEHALLTLAEAAAYLRVHRRTLTRLLRDGLVPGVKIGRQWRVRKADLDAYFTRAVGPTTGNGSARPRDSSSVDQEPAG
jgi:excisionase family DNA binding protein